MKSIVIKFKESERMEELDVRYLGESIDEIKNIIKLHISGQEIHALGEELMD